MTSLVAVVVVVVVDVIVIAVGVTVENKLDIWTLEKEIKVWLREVVKPFLQECYGPLK